jgi:CheY-like chemotaxis protein
MARVLVVEDHPDSRDLMAFALERGGHEVFAADDGQAAMALVDALRRFDVAVIDMYLPVKDGLQMIRELRDDKRPRYIVAVSAGARATKRAVVSRAEDFGILEEAAAAGADVTLAKPFEPEVLVQLIDDLLARK